jgi:hypothetical protein
MDETTGDDRAPGSAATSDLVEPEGVNAASREIIDEHSTGDGDVTSGGSPERAAEQVTDGPSSEQMVGVPGNRDDAPGQELSVGEG